MCASCCDSGRRARCPSCVQLGGDGFPFSRNDFDLSRLFTFVWQAFQRELPMLILTGLVVIGGQIVGSVLSQIVQAIAGGIGSGIGGEKTGVATTLLASVIVLPFSTVLQGLLTMGSFRMYLDVLLGKKADFARVFSQVGKLGQYVVQLLAIGVLVIPAVLAMGVVFGISLVVGGVGLTHADKMFDRMNGFGIAVLVLGAIVLYVAIIFFTLSVIFAQMELVYGGCSGVEALQRTWSLASGNRLTILGYLMVSGLIAIVSIAACCVGFLAGFPLSQMLLVGLYLSLRKGSGLPDPVET